MTKSPTDPRGTHGHDDEPGDAGDAAAAPNDDDPMHAPAGDPAPATNGGDMELYDLRVSVEEIHGRSVCGMCVGDYFELVNSNELRLPDGKHFCAYALASVLPLLPAKQRRLPEGDWLERDNLVCCPDPEERLVMRIERTGVCRLNSDDLT